MRFGFDDDTLEFRDAVRSLLALDATVAVSVGRGTTGAEPEDGGGAGRSSDRARTHGSEISRARCPRWR